MHVAINSQCERSMVYVFANKCYWSTPLLLMGVLMYVRIKCSSDIVEHYLCISNITFWHMIILGQFVRVKEAWSISLLTKSCY